MSGLCFPHPFGRAKIPSRLTARTSTHDPRNNAAKAFLGPYQTFLDDEASIDAIAKGTWSSAAEAPGFRGGYRRYGASKLFLVMMMHSLQTRLTHDPALGRLCVLGVDPGTMSTGLQRHSVFFIRVVLFGIIYPLIAWWNPNGPVRTPARSAGHVARAAFDNGPGLGEAPKDVYLDGTVPRETGEESRDVQKRQWVWKASVGMAGLAQSETALADAL